MTMQQVGEVIQSGTGSFVAQSYSVNEAPPFGSLVRARLEGQETSIYGVVSKIETSPLDPSRRPVARGQEAGSLAEIYQDHPQLKELFRTEFTATVVGHARDGSLYHHLPPLPPEIHQLVYSCADEEVAAFTRGLGFLPLLLSGQGTPGPEEVVAAFLRHAARARGEEGHAFLVRAGKQLVPLLRGESVRLTSLLAKLR